MPTLTRQPPDFGELSRAAVATPAGPELDARVAREVMGWVELKTLATELYRWRMPGGTWYGKPPSFSGDGTWWLRIERVMDEMGLWMVLKSPFGPHSGWFAGFTTHDHTGWSETPDFKGYGATAGEAVCRAALAVVGGKLSE